MMPSVRKVHAAVVHGRDQRAQAASSSPDNNAETANENATAKPTYPMYRMGGCETMPGSCSNGLRSRPSIAGGKRRVNGLEVQSMNATKPALIQLITPSTRATMGRGSCLLNTDTAAIHHVSSKVQSSSEPSWPPQTAAKR